MSKVLTVCVAKTQIIQHENTKIISMMTGDTPKDRQVTVSGSEEARERERESVCVCVCVDSQQAPLNWPGDG